MTYSKQIKALKEINTMRVNKRSCAFWRKKKKKTLSWQVDAVIVRQSRLSIFRVQIFELIRKCFKQTKISLKLTKLRPIMCLKCSLLHCNVNTWHGNFSLIHHWDIMASHIKVKQM